MISIFYMTFFYFSSLFFMQFNSQVSSFSSETRNSERTQSCPPFPCAFDPMDSDTWDNLGFTDPIYYPCPDAQILPHHPSHESFSSTDSESETYSENPEPSIRTDPTEDAVHLTDLKNLRQTLGTLSNYNGGQLGQHLKSFQGLLVMPLHAVSVLRIPHGTHTLNPNVLIYFPTKLLDRYPHLETFNKSIGMVYPSNSSQ